MDKAINFFLLLFMLGLFLASCNSDPYKHSNVHSYLEFVFENNLKGQIALFTAEKNVKRKDFFYLLLPFHERSSVGYVPKEPKVIRIDNYFKSKYNITDNSTTILEEYPFESLDYKNPIDLKIALIHLDFQNAQQKVLQNQLIKIEENINYTNKDNLSIWMSLEYLKMKMELYYYFGRNDEAILCASFARNILANHNNSMLKFIPEIEYRYLMNFAEEDAVKKSELFDASYNILENGNNPLLLLDFISLDIINLETRDSSRFENLFFRGKKILESNLVTPFHQDYFYQSVSTYYSSIGNFKTAIEYNLKSISLHENVSCSVPKSVGYIYMANNLMQSLEIDSAQNILNKSVADNTCEVVPIMRIQNYYSMISSNLNAVKYDINPKSEYLRQRLFDLKKARGLQEKIFTDKYDLHGYDAFVSNSEDQLSSYQNLGINESSKVDIIYLFEDSKLRNLKIKKMEDAIENKLTGYRKLDRLNASINELKSSVSSADYSDSRYREIYFLNKEKQALIKKILPDTEDYKIDKQKIIENINSIEESKRAHLEILMTPYNYWYYFLVNEDFVLRSIPKKKVDLLIKDIRKEVFQQQNAAAQIQEIKDYFDFEIPSDVTLSVSTDGSFNHMPFGLLFDNRFYKSLGSLSINEIDLEFRKSDFSIYSFTDESTNRNISKVLKYPELLSSFTNCTQLQNIIGRGNTSLITGENFTKDKLLNHEKSSGWHISTHAVSTPQSYYDNFFVARTGNGGTEEIYTYDVLKIKNPPKFLAFSACSTGIGDSKIGAGDFSLSRPFHEIGTNTIVTTLWEVNDDVTAEFFKTFYNEWVKDGNSVLDAFENAKTEIKTKYHDPYYWAPFVLEGNPNVYLSKD